MAKKDSTRPRESQAELLARGYGKNFASSTMTRNEEGKVAFEPPKVKEVSEQEAVSTTREIVNLRRIRSVLQAHAVVDAALTSQTISLEKRADIALRAIATFEGQKQVIEYDTRKDGPSATWDNLQKLKDRIKAFDKYLDPKQKGEALARTAAGAILTLDKEEKEDEEKAN